MNRIINIRFTQTQTQIMLEHKKRLRNKEVQLRLKQIKKDIFNLKINAGTTMRKYFKTIQKYSDLNTYKSISFFNFRDLKKLTDLFNLNV